MTAAGPSFVVVLPTYNERLNIEKVTAGILQHERGRLLVVDDNSPDGTGAIADALVDTHHGRINVMHRTGTRGLGRSYVDVRDTLSIISTIRLPKPAPMVQPSVPWPVLSQSLPIRVRPISGTLDGVAGRSPAQNSAAS